MDEPVDSIGIDEIIAKDTKPTSKESLKVLSEKEKDLKDSVLRLFIDNKVTDREIIRVCAFILNAHKQIVKGLTCKK